jgi:diacylglycerol kinase family enzyme
LQSHKLRGDLLAERGDEAEQPAQIRLSGAQNETGLHRVALLDNPASGQTTPRRDVIVEKTLAALRAADIAAEHLVIDGPGSGAALTRQAIADGCDAVLVCGGDGTVHEVMQCLVGTDVALGVIPLGTANALAANLGLSKSPAKAIQALLTAIPTQVPVGRITYRDDEGVDRWRYFTVAAGVGADALLMSRMDPGLKRRMGYALYVLEAVRLWVSHPFPLFQARFTARSGGAPRTIEISQLLAVRVRSFGGALGELVPSASLHNHRLRLLAFKTRSRFRYLLFLLAVLTGRHTFNREVELLKADSVDCMPRDGSLVPVYVEADGEVLGQLPVRLEIAAETLTLLIPRDAKP